MSFNHNPACVPRPCSRVRLFVTPQTVTHQAPLSMGFSRQGYWSGVPFPLPGDLPNPGIEPSFIKSPALAGEFFTTRDTWEAHRSLGSWENSERLCLNDVWSIVGIKKPVTVQTAGRWIDKLWPSLGFPGVSDGKESVCNRGDLGLIPGLGGSPGGGSGNRLQYSFLENPMDRGAWRAAVHGVAELDTTEWLIPG